MGNNTSGKQKGSQRRSSRIRERRDSFGSVRRDSRSSHPPSFTKNSDAENSRGSPDGRRNFEKQTSRHFRRSSTGMNLSGAGSKRKDSHGVESSKVKEPPAGRGYERRKARLAAAAAAAEEAERAAA